MSEEERRRSDNEQLAQVKAVPPQVLAAMMVSLVTPSSHLSNHRLLTFIFHFQEELGESRLDTLPMTDRGRNHPVRAGFRAPSDNNASLAPRTRNQWTGKSRHPPRPRISSHECLELISMFTAAIESGKFNDAEAEGVKNLDPLGGPRAHKVREQAGRILQDTPRGAFELPQDYNTRGPSVFRGSRSGGRGYGHHTGRGGEQPPWATQPPRTSPMGAVLDDRTPVRSYGQNRLNTDNLPKAKAPETPSAQPKIIHSHWANGVVAPSTPNSKNVRNTAQPTQIVQNTHQPMQKSARPVAETSTNNEKTQIETLAPASQTAVEALPSTVSRTAAEAKPPTVTEASEPSPSNYVFTALVRYLHRDTNAPKLGLAKVHLATAYTPDRGFFIVVFPQGCKAGKDELYRLKNVRLAEPADTEYHRLLLGCKKESRGPEVEHPIQFQDGRCMGDFLTTLDRLRNGEAIEVIPGEPVVVAQTTLTNGTTAPQTVDSQVPPAEMPAITIGTEPITAPQKEEAHPSPAEVSQPEASTPTRQTAAVPGISEPLVTPRVAIERSPADLISFNTPSPHQSPARVLLSLDSSPDTESTQESAVHDLANLEPWFAPPAARTTVPWFAQTPAKRTQTPELGGLADSFKTLRISNPVVQEEHAEAQHQAKNDIPAQVEEQEPKATVESENEGDIQAALADDDEKTVPMRNALIRLEENLLNIFQQGGLPEDTTAIKDTIKGIKQAVVDQIRPLVKEASFFSLLTEAEKLEVIKDFLDSPIHVAQEVSDFEPESSDSSPSSSLTAVNAEADGPQTGRIRIEYTNEQMLVHRSRAVQPPPQLFQLDFLPLNTGKTRTGKQAPHPTTSSTAAESLNAQGPSLPFVNETVDDTSEDDGASQDVNANNDNKRVKNTVPETNKSGQDLASVFQQFLDSLSPGTKAATKKIMAEASQENAIVEEQPNGTLEQANANMMDVNSTNENDTVPEEKNTNMMDTNSTHENGIVSEEQTNGTTEQMNGSPAGNESCVLATLNPAAADFAPVPMTPQATPVTATAPLRGLGSSRWATETSKRVGNEGRFTGIFVRTNRA